jgi:hypothetical protein
VARVSLGINAKRSRIEEQPEEPFVLREKVRLTMLFLPL